MNDTLHFMEQLITKITPYAVSAGKAGYDVALQVERINCFDALIQNFAFCLVFTIPTIFFIRWALYDIQGEEHDQKVGTQGRASYLSNIKFWEMGGAVSCITVVGVIASVASLFFLFTSTWDWVGLFYPQLALAHDIITKVLSHT